MRSRERKVRAAHHMNQNRNAYTIETDICLKVYFTDLSVTKMSLNPMPQHLMECKLKRALDELREFVT